MCREQGMDYTGSRQRLTMRLLDEGVSEAGRQEDSEGVGRRAISRRGGDDDRTIDDEETFEGDRVFYRLTYLDAQLHEGRAKYDQVRKTS